VLLLALVSTGLREDDAVVSYHPDPPQLLRARLRLALHSRGEQELNGLVHHERGRYSSFQVEGALCARVRLFLLVLVKRSAILEQAMKPA